MTSCNVRSMYAIFGIEWDRCCIYCKKILISLFEFQWDFCNKYAYQWCVAKRFFSVYFEHVEDVINCFPLRVFEIRTAVAKRRKLCQTEGTVRLSSVRQQFWLLHECLRTFDETLMEWNTYIPLQVLLFRQDPGIQADLWREKLVVKYILLYQTSSDPSASATNLSKNMWEEVLLILFSL